MAFRKNIQKLSSFYIDTLLLLPIILFTTWVYLIPPLQTFGYHPLFSDDAIFAILARKVTEIGFSGAFHLTWGPLLPWLNALLNIIFKIPLDEGPRIITGLSLTLRVIPVYFLAKALFGKLAAFITIFLTSIYTFIVIPQEAALAEGLYSLVVFTGFYFSYQALKTLKPSWYFFSGLTWGLAYLARLEGWFFIIPLLLLTGLKFSSGIKNNFQTIKLLAILLLAFLIISSPYLIFIRQAYGSWTLNPRVNITIMQPGNNFEPYLDKNGITTSVQVYASGDIKSYDSNLWHPKPALFWTQISRQWSVSSSTPLNYYNFFKQHVFLFFILGYLGILLAIYKIFQKNLRLLIPLIAIVVLIFVLIDFLLAPIEFLSTAIFSPNTDLDYFIKKYKLMLSLQPIRYFEFAIISIIISLLLNKRSYLKKLFRYSYLQKLQIYLLLSFSLGLIPLFFNSFAPKYLVVFGGILAFYASFLTISICSYVIQIFSKIYPKFPHSLLKIITYILAIFIIFWLNLSYFYQALETRQLQNKKDSFRNTMYKNPGLAILKDHGPGAKVAIFHEAPALYAQGTVFYIMASSTLPLTDSLSYLEKNQVDYLVINQDQLASSIALESLLNPKTKLSNWKIIYPYPIKYNEQGLDVAVWKRVK